MNRRLFITYSSISFAISRVPGVSLYGQPLAGNGESEAATQQAHWLKHLPEADSNTLINNNRFQELIRHCFGTIPLERLGSDIDIVRTLSAFILGSQGNLEVQHKRYVSACGFCPHFALSHGMIWIDTHSDASDPHPTIVMSMVDRGKGAQRLWMLHNKGFNDRPYTLPNNFRHTLKRWLKQDPIKYAGRLRDGYLVNSEGKVARTNLLEAGAPLHRVDTKGATWSAPASILQ